MIERGLRPKTKEQLNIQVNNVSETLGTPIAPPISANGEIFNLVPSNLKEKFPVRYEIYVDTLRRRKRSEESNLLYKRRLYALNALDRYINTYYSQNQDERTLFDPQMNAFEALRMAIEERDTEGYIRLPTGSGKTVVFTEFVEATDLKTLIVVPTRILVDQTETRFKEFAPGVETGKVYMQSKEYEKPVTITTYASFLKDVEAGKIKPEDYELLILDEAHESLSQRRMDAVRRFTNAIKLGFTATPRYTKEKHLGNLLNTEIHNMPIREAVELGILSPLSVYLAKTDVDLSEVKITSTGEYKDEDLERAINIAARNTDAVDLYKAMFLGQKALAYCVTVNHAVDLAARFEQGGIKAAVVSSYQSAAEQKNALEKYKTGEIDVLCNADLLIQGFDEPSVNVCLNLRPTASPVVAEQRAGRVLRPNPSNPFKHAYIVDFIDQSGDPNRFPISFAQILESAHVFRKDNPPDYPRQDTGTGTILYPQIEISGLKVITEAEEVMRVIREMVDQQYQIPQEGWFSIPAVASRFRIHGSTIKRIISNYRETNPEHFRMFRPVHGSVPKEHISSELVEIIQEMRGNLRAPIEGWMHMPAIIDELGVSRELIERLIKKYRDENSSYFRVFRMEDGRLSEHYSPELLDILKTKVWREYSSIGPPQEGWLTYSKAGRLLRTHNNKNVEKLAQPHKETNPEFFANFRINKGKGAVREHISPQLVEILAQQVNNIPHVEEGWDTKEGLIKILGMGDNSVNVRLSEYRENHPEYFQLFKSPNGRILEYISPELRSILQSQREGFTSPEEGWLSYAILAQDLGVTTVTTRKITEKYKKSYPEYFKLFLTTRGHLREYVSPELAAFLKEERKKIDRPKEGWKTVYALGNELGVSAGGIYNFVSKFRKSNPEYFTLHRDTKNRVSEHLSPKLIDLLKNEYIKTHINPPEGWFTWNDAATVIGASRKTLEKIAQRYHSSRPKLLKQYQRGRKIAWFVSPELIELIKQDITQAPEGWLNRSAVDRQMGQSYSSYSDVSDFIEQFRESNPEWFRYFRGRGKRPVVSEHHAPELVEKIREHFKENNNV